MRVTGAIFTLALAFAGAIAAAACAGPRLTASDVRVVPSPLPGHQRVQAMLVNRGGKGEAKVVVRLRDAAGRTVSANHTVEFERKETVELVLDVPAPPGKLHRRIGGHVSAHLS
jgi:hypothetical protein